MGKETNVVVGLVRVCFTPSRHQTFDPSCRGHFVDLAEQIHAFIQDLK
jgi:hypothetical protein